MGFTDAVKGMKCLLPPPLSSSFFAAKHLPSCKKSLSSFRILCLCLCPPQPSSRFLLLLCLSPCFIESLFLLFFHRKSVKEDRRRVSYNQPYLLNHLHVFCSSSSCMLVSVLNTNKLAFLFPTDDGIFSQNQKICERLMTPQEDRGRKDAQERGEIQGKNNVKERLACTKKENTYL